MCKTQPVVPIYHQQRHIQLKFFTESYWDVDGVVIHTPFLSGNGSVILLQASFVFVANVICLSIFIRHDFQLGHQWDSIHGCFATGFQSGLCIACSCPGTQDQSIMKFHNIIYCQIPVNKLVWELHMRKYLRYPLNEMGQFLEIGFIMSHL